MSLFFTGCQEEDNSKETGGEVSEREELKKVTLNEVAHSIFYAPQYVAIEEGYFVEEGIKLEVVTGFGADKVMASVLSGESDIGFMGSESSIYAYQQGANDPVINFAQLTQRAGNFIVAREEMPDFQWTDLIGKDVLVGRKSGMPEMVFEYILKEKGIDPDKDVNIDRSIDFGSTAAAFAGGQGEFSVEFEPSATALEQEGAGYVVASCGVESGYVPYTAYSAKESYIKYTGRGLSQGLPTFSLVDEKGAFPCFPGLHLSLLPAPLGHGLCLCTPQAVSQLTHLTLPGADGGKD